MVDLVRSGRTPEELAREFEPTAQSISTWVKQAERDAGKRIDGPTSAEREELGRLRRENHRLRQERDTGKGGSLVRAGEQGGARTGLPVHERASHDDASQPFLDIGSLRRVARKLRLLWAASSALGVPLRWRRTILEAAASGGGVAPQLSGNCRCHPPEPASDLLHGVALNAKERDLLPFRKREIPTRERLRR